MLRLVLWTISLVLPYQEILNYLPLFPWNHIKFNFCDLLILFIVILFQSKLSSQYFMYTCYYLHHSTYPANICWSWRRLEDVFNTSSTRLQRNNFTSSKTSWRRLKDVLEDEKLLRWRRFEDVLKTCLEDVSKMPWS